MMEVGVFSEQSLLSNIGPKPTMSKHCPTSNGIRNTPQFKRVLLMSVASQVALHDHLYITFTSQFTFTRSQNALQYRTSPGPNFATFFG